jgi:hypothetical protein
MATARSKPGAAISAPRRLERASGGAAGGLAAAELGDQLGALALGEPADRLAG